MAFLDKVCNPIKNFNFLDIFVLFSKVQSIYIKVCKYLIEFPGLVWCPQIDRVDKVKHRFGRRFVRLHFDLNARGRLCIILVTFLRQIIFHHHSIFSIRISLNFELRNYLSVSVFSWVDTKFGSLGGKTRLSLSWSWGRICIDDCFGIGLLCFTWPFFIKTWSIFPSIFFYFPFFQCFYWLFWFF